MTVPVPPLPASVAAGHPDTARAGLAVLRAGGSAADAVAAMILAGCVAETIFTGLGGGGFVTVYDATAREVTCLDFFVAVPGLDGTVPGPARPIEVALGGVALPYTMGGPTVAVPGTPAGVAALHRRFGRLPWAEIVTPARDLAAAGTAFPAEHAAVLPDIATAMLEGDGLAAYWQAEHSTPGQPGGRLLGAGERLHHPGLSDTLDAYRDQGAEALMDGDFAAALVGQVRADGGALSLEDLRAYRVRELPVSDVGFGPGRVRVRTNDLDHYAQTVGALDCDRIRLGGGHRALALVQALRAPARRAETTSVAAVDGDGNACSATHSLGLGSGLWAGGVHANSMLGEGELLRGDLVPGSRMGSMMVPQVVTGADGRVVLVAGAAGGSRIRPALVQVLAGILVENRSVADAVAAPRLSAAADTVHLEPGFPPEVDAALVAAGDTVRHWEHRSAYFGGVSVIGPTGPAADPRRGGVALLVSG